MDDAAKTALDTLVEIAEDTNAKNDERIRAACSILDWFKHEKALTPA